ncbi:hypothetical protein [Legionella qingyii]|nr:hypothetical protein [Legionella qingyii]
MPIKGARNSDLVSQETEEEGAILLQTREEGQDFGTNYTKVKVFLN